MEAIDSFSEQNYGSGDKCTHEMGAVETGRDGDPKEESSISKHQTVCRAGIFSHVSQ